MNVIKKENPPSSGHSKQGAKLGQSPFTNDINPSITHHRENFNRSDKFDIRLLQNVKGRNGQYTALCPAHNDKTRSLSVKIANDRVLLNCFAGCSAETIMGALDLPMSALFLTEDKPLSANKKPKQKPKQKPRQSNSITYEYTNMDGSIAYRKIRYEYSDGSKTFAFYTPEGKKGVSGIQRVPYNLPAVLTADTVYFVEGEKAADAVKNAGYAAVSLDAGANSKWLPEYNAYFEGKTVIILPDNDTPGMNYAKSIARHISGSKIVKLTGLPEKGDVYDWLAAGRTMDEINKLPREEIRKEIRDEIRDEIEITDAGQIDSKENLLPSEPGFIAINPFKTKAARNRYKWNDIGISNLFADCYKD